MRYSGSRDSRTRNCRQLRDPWGSRMCSCRDLWASGAPERVTAVNSGLQGLQGLDIAYIYIYTERVTVWAPYSGCARRKMSVSLRRGGHFFKNDSLASTKLYILRAWGCPTCCLVAMAGLGLSNLLSCRHGWLSAYLHGVLAGWLAGWAQPFLFFF